MITYHIVKIGGQPSNEGSTNEGATCAAWVNSTDKTTTEVIAADFSLGEVRRRYTPAESERVVWLFRNSNFDSSRFLSPGGTMLKSQLLAALKAEIHRHDFSHFVEKSAISRARRKGRRCAGLPCNEASELTGASYLLFKNYYSGA